MNLDRQKELLNNTVSTVEEYIVFLQDTVKEAENPNNIPVSALTIEMACSLLNLEKTLMMAFFEWGETNADALNELAERFKKMLEERAEVLKNTEEMNR